MSNAVQVLADDTVNDFGITAEEFFATCKLEHAELIDGEIVELMAPGFNHGNIAGNIYAALKAYLREHNVGRVSVEGGFRLRRRPDRMRSPDVSFVTHARLEGQNADGFLEGAPDLAIEVNSPNDRWNEVESKVQLYFEAGARSVWIVEPALHSITIRTPDNAPRTFMLNDTLRDETVLIGFELPLREVFEG